MDKSQLLEEVKGLSKEGLLTKDELLQAYYHGQQLYGQPEKNTRISEIMYYIGGAIVFLGIAILIGQNWTVLNFTTKLLVTLGAAIIAYVSGLLFNRDERYRGAGNAFYLISALAAPLGLFVLFDRLGLDANSSLIQALIAASLFIVYFISFYFQRRKVFEIFLFIFGSWLFFAVLATIAYDFGNAVYNENSFVEYRFLVTGISYLLFGYWYTRAGERALTGALYGFGSLFMLGAAMALGGLHPNQNTFWEISFPVLAFAIIFASAYVRSKALLTFGSIFLMIYILKISGEYFSSSLGWPLALVLAGLLLMAVGYSSVWIGKKYISQA